MIAEISDNLNKPWVVAIVEKFPFLPVGSVGGSGFCLTAKLKILMASYFCTFIR